MREIKFRGLTNDGKWIYGDLITDGFKSKNSFANIFPISANEYTFDLCVQVELSTVGQYTGLKDKNGVDIYEGDIVYHERIGKGKVTWLSNRCGFFVVYYGIGTDVINRKPYQSAYKMNALKYEVIGNIHQNPELCKK